jgi:hypothetical protein
VCINLCMHTIGEMVKSQIALEKVKSLEMVLS